MVLRDRRAELRERYTNPHGESGRFKHPIVPVNNWGWTEPRHPSKIDYGDHARKVPLPKAKITIKGLTAAHHAVYEFCDIQDQALYVGMTNDPRKRFEQHRRNISSSEWWRFVHHVKPLIWCPSAAEAAHMETTVKMKRRPLYGDGGIWAPA